MPHVLVVGGGSTGTAVARDLALRGADVTLVERGGLAAGTTGRMHGLLHSGARYANADPESARDCAAENEVLRDIAPHCVDDTGGLFVQHADDEPYLDAKAAACRDCDVPVERLSAAEAREAEPALADDVTGALRVPDGTVDPFRLCAANALAAEEAGATVRTGTAVTDLRVADGRVVGAELDGAETVDADHVVNAAGPWADRLAGLAGCSAPVRHSQGAMVVLDSHLSRVVNRCRPKGEGDIAVPHGAGAVLGTTDESVSGPDAVERDETDVERVVAELAAVLPGVADAPRLHAYWGVRPLADPEASGPGDASRDFAVVDHREVPDEVRNLGLSEREANGVSRHASREADRREASFRANGERQRPVSREVKGRDASEGASGGDRRKQHTSRATDGVEGFTSVVGGKVTTCRLMAERTADAVSERLGLDGDCRTADAVLPVPDDAVLARYGLAGDDRPPVVVPEAGSGL